MLVDFSCFDDGSPRSVLLCSSLIVLRRKQRPLLSSRLMFVEIFFQVYTVAKLTVHFFSLRSPRLDLSLCTQCEF